MTVEARGRLSTDRGLGTGDGMGSSKVTYGKGLDTSPDYGEKILSSMEMLKKAPTGIKPLMGKTARGV
ncbi:MAG: hypothetical protein ACUVV4_08920 [Candidatus Bathyarchaeia archaeon]